MLDLIQNFTSSSTFGAGSTVDFGFHSFYSLPRYCSEFTFIKLLKFETSTSSLLFNRRSSLHSPLHYLNTHSFEALFFLLSIHPHRDRIMPSLFSLLPELRNNIYDLVLTPSPHAIKSLHLMIHDGRLMYENTNMPELLCVCVQIYTEALEIHALKSRLSYIVKLEDLGGEVTELVFIPLSANICGEYATNLPRIQNQHPSFLEAMNLQIEIQLPPSPRRVLPRAILQHHEREIRHYGPNESYTSR